MTEFVYYLLKVVICSGILFLYYALALRNKLFHQWNRFYLLAAVILSTIVPLIQVTITNRTNGAENNAIQLLQAVESTNNYLEEITIYSNNGFSQEQWVAIVYLFIMIILLTVFIHSLYRISLIVRSHSINHINNIKFINTKISGTPFSFLNLIFWNEAIDLRSHTGEKIFQHEMVHVREKHTLDKLFIQLVLVIFWCNPFFWIIRRELKLVHEFIADKKAIPGQGAEVLAAMILQTAYPKQFNAIINPFFQTSIKRRLLMISKIQNPKFNYLNRLVVLPLIALTVLAFTIRTKNLTASVPLGKTVTVVIDAGHGYENGKHTGAAMDQNNEDDITLAIAKKVLELNSNNEIKIVLSRSTDQSVSLAQRVETARQHNADLFLSIHVAASPQGGKESGMQVYIPSKSPSYQKESELFASAIMQELGSVYTVSPSLLKNQTSIYVLDKNICPSVLIECGFITNKRDQEFISKANNQAAIARKIISAIEKYALSSSVPTKSSPPKITTLTLLENDKYVFGYADGTKEVLTKEEAIKKYGNEIKIEDVVIDSRKADHILDRPVFEKVEIEPSINKAEWRKFLVDNLSPLIPGIAKKAPAGKYTINVRFIVEEDGSLSDIKTLNDPGYNMKEQVLSIMKKAPKWSPGIQNGRKVRAYHTQPVTIVIEGG